MVLVKDLIGLGGGGPIRQLARDLVPELCRIGCCDHILKGRLKKHGHVQIKKFLVAHGIGFRKTLETSRPQLVIDDLIWI